MGWSEGETTPTHGDGLDPPFLTGPPGRLREAGVRIIPHALIPAICWFSVEIGVIAGRTV